MNASIAWARDQLRQLFVWDTAEKQRINRAAAAMGYGLSPDAYARPFPGSPPTTVTIMQQTEAPRSGLLKKALIATALAVGAGGGGAAALLARKPEQAVTAPPPPPSQEPPAAGPQEYEIPWEIGPDGKLKWGEPRRVK